MTYSLAVRPDAPLAAVLVSLRRLRAREIVVALPLGEAALLADATALQQLALFCQHTGKEIAIIGGDQTLRALAVAAGFVVATSLEDHEQRATQQIVRRHPHMAWEDAYAQFAVRRTPRQSRPRPRDDEPQLDEPPDYVRRLLEEMPAIPVVYAAPPDATMQRNRHTTRKLPAVEEGDLVREAYESDEDTVTETIRNTGTLGQRSRSPRLSLLPRSFSSQPASPETP